MGGGGGAKWRVGAVTRGEGKESDTNVTQAWILSHTLIHLIEYHKPCTSHHAEVICTSNYNQN